MKSWKILFGVALTMTIIIGMNTASLAEKPTLSISELRNQTPQRWTQNYEAHGRTISVDVTIEIPNVTQMPIINSTKGTKVFPAEVRSEYSMNHGDRLGMFDGFLGEKLLRSQKNGEAPIQNDFYPNGQTPTTVPENNPNSFEHALGVVTRRISDLSGFEYKKDFILAYTYVRGRLFHNGKPTTDMGTYWMGFNQQFNGITLSTTSAAHAAIGTDYYDDQNIQIAIVYAFDSYEIAIEDVPLISFDVVRKTLEKEIMAGRLRSVDSVRLCYRAFLVSQKDGYHYKFMPVWEIVGQRAESADYEPKTIELGKNENVLHWEMEAVQDISAQDGTLFKDNSLTSVVKPNIITWADVK